MEEGGKHKMTKLPPPKRVDLRCKPPIPYWGSKVKLAPKIIALMPQHTCYVDVFGGSGAVILAKAPAKVDVYNDIDGDLVNMYRVIRDPAKFEELVRLCELQPYSRDDYNRYKADGFGGMTDTERASAFIMLVNSSMSGKIGSGFGITNKGHYTPIMSYLQRVFRLPDIHNRMRGVFIENLSFDKLLHKYDDPWTCFYLDPPYLPSTRVSTNDYRNEGGYALHVNLLPMLYRLRGGVVLSGYPGSIYDMLESKGFTRHEFGCTTSGNALSCLKSSRTEVVWVRGPL